MVPEAGQPPGQDGVTSSAATGTLRDGGQRGGGEHRHDEDVLDGAAPSHEQDHGHEHLDKEGEVHGIGEARRLPLDDVGEGGVVGDHAQRVGHQSPPDGVGHAQHGTDHGEPESDAAADPAVGAVDAPAHHPQHQVGEPEGPAAVHVEPHPHERHERPRWALVGLDHDDEDGEEHQRDEQWP